MATIKFIDENGKTLEREPRRMLGIKELSTVVVRGRVVRDDKDNLTVLAAGLYHRPNDARQGEPR